MPGSKQISEQKFRIKDIADHPVKEKSNRRRFQEKVLISLTKRDRIEQFREQGYNVVYDPSGDGNCQFSALCFALRNIGLHRSPETLRREVAQYLNSNDVANGILLAFFAGVPWEQYLQEMQMDGTYGDEITLRAISNIFNGEIIIVSTLGQGGRVEIVPENTNPFTRITLGHFAEGHREHYVTLEDLNEVSSESEVDITNIDDSAVENIEDEDNNLENLPEENINLEQLSLEILERIFLLALISPDYTFPNHVCWTFNNMINAVPVFRLFEKKGMDYLPLVDISDPFALPKQRNKHSLTCSES